MADYRAIFLDADGTIFDYDRGEKFALEKTLQDFAIKGNVGEILDLYREINRIIWGEFEKGEISAEKLKTDRFRRLSAELDVNFDTERFSDIYLEHLGQAAFLFHGSREALDRLKDEYILILLTNGLSRVQRSRVKLAELEKHFQDLIISEEIGEAKPAPGIFARALEAAGNPPKEMVLMVGDSLASDIKGGLKFGLDTCWIRENGKEPDPDLNPTFIIDHFNELPEVLKEGNK